MIFKIKFLNFKKAINTINNNNNMHVLLIMISYLEIKRCFSFFKKMVCKNLQCSYIYTPGVYGKKKTELIAFFVS